jgi:hypothetical protein
VKKIEMDKQRETKGAEMDEKKKFLRDRNLK